MRVSAKGKKNRIEIGKLYFMEISINNTHHITIHRWFISWKIRT
jgi:hypothetical protein